MQYETLQAKNISFGYDEKHLILNKINLTIKRGERVGIIGPSGCGKSTLAQILAGLIKPASGEVLFNGKPLPQKGYCPVQLIFQHPEKAVNPRRKMRRTLAEGFQSSKGISSSNRRDKQNLDMEFLIPFGIEQQWLDRYPVELSGGEIQRFCIARALANSKCCFLLADEISTMLDVITQAQIWNLLLSAAEKKGLGLLVVTHNEHLAEKICTRIIRFEEL
ncbi:MAG: ATP-binding cassette domain-containing protein [Termitinemataceae bacterium]|nr:MAG: ATP-binding cassette domain-containing protein [Termitinemataceae bacterium]